MLAVLGSFAHLCAGDFKDLTGSNKCLVVIVSVIRFLMDFGGSVRVVCGRSRM